MIHTFTLRAVNQVLFGQGHQFACLLEVLTLQGSSGGERPTGAALTLVLDGGDVAFFTPVHLSWGLEVAGGHKRRGGAGLVARTVAIQLLHELLSSLERIKRMDVNYSASNASMEKCKLYRNGPKIQAKSAVQISRAELFS